MLRAREGKMLNAERAERMLEAATFEDAAKLLTDCGYEDMSLMDVNGVNDALARFRAAQVAELSVLVPDPAVLDLFRMKYGYHNAKVIVKSRGDVEKNRHLLPVENRGEDFIIVYSAYDLTEGKDPKGHHTVLADIVEPFPGRTTWRVVRSKQWEEYGFTQALAVRTEPEEYTC